MLPKVIYSVAIEMLQGKDQESIVEFRVVMNLGRPYCTAGETMIWLVFSLVNDKITLNFRRPATKQQRQMAESIVRISEVAGRPMLGHHSGSENRANCYGC
jgi:hypothetical protein